MNKSEIEKPKSRLTKPKPNTIFERKKYEDEDGIPRVVLAPPDENDLKRGIPVSLDLSPLIGHMPQEFQQSFYKALHKHGLVEPKDFMMKGAAEKYRRALQDVIKHDFLNVQALAKQETQS